MLMVSEKREIAGWMLEITYEPEMDASAAVESVAVKLYFLRPYFIFLSILVLENLVMNLVIS